MRAPFSFEGTIERVVFDVQQVAMRLSRRLLAVGVAAACLAVSADEIDPDALAKIRQRVAGLPNVTVVEAGVADTRLPAP